jgi:hypothetical protein
MSPSIHFPVLENMLLKGFPLMMSSDNDDVVNKFHVSIAAFVNRHNATLKSLSLPWIDATGIYFSLLLDHFPRLQQLDLEFRIAPEQQRIVTSTPTSLTRFLNNHADVLRKLTYSLYSNITYHADTTMGDNSLDNTVMELILQNTTHAGLTNLVALEIFVGLQTLPKHTILETACHFSDTLTTLVLDTLTYLAYEEVELLVSAFSHRSLDTLSIVVDILSPQLVDVIAFSLPNLMKLTLKAVFVRSERSNSVQAAVNPDIDPRTPSIDVFFAFLEEMRKRVYNDWALRHVQVYAACSSEYCSWLTEVVAARIPNASVSR